jgi:hypothetical protein
VIDVTEILVHWHAGRPEKEMAHSLGVDRKTLRKYIAPAEAAGIRLRTSARPARGAVLRWRGVHPGAERGGRRAGALTGSRPPSVPVQGGATPPGSRYGSDLRLVGYSHAAISTYKRSYGKNQSSDYSLFECEHAERAGQERAGVGGAGAGPGSRSRLIPGCGR